MNWMERFVKFVLFILREKNFVEHEKSETHFKQKNKL